MQTLSALCNAPVVGLQAPTCDGLNSIQRDEILEVNQRMNIWKPFLRVALVLGLVIFLAGCIIVPLPRQTIEQNFKDDKLSFLVKSQTSKSEVRENLGDPDVAFLDGSNWIYTMRIYQSVRWGGCQLSGASPLCETTVGKRMFKVLKIDFDDHGVVSDWSKSSAVVGKCTKRDICKTAEGYIVYASSDADAEAKKFAGVGGACTVYAYVFVDTYFFPTSVQINDVFSLVMRGKNTFLRWTLPTGTYVAYATSTNVAYATGKGRANTAELECVADDIAFLEIGREQQGRRKITLASKDRGQSAVLERNLVLTEDVRTSYSSD